jgi:hypothetical protein
VGGLDHCRERVIGTRHQHFDRAVDAVAHPAAQADLGRHPRRPDAVTDALDATGDLYSNGLHRR